MALIGVIVGKAIAITANHLREQRKQLRFVSNIKGALAEFAVLGEQRGKIVFEGELHSLHEWCQSWEFGFTFVDTQFSGLAAEQLFEQCASFLNSG